MNDADAVLQTRKICTACGQSLLWWEFIPCKSRKPLFPLPSRCCQCRSAISKAYREQHRERLLGLQREWNARNAERLKPYRAEWYQAHQEQRRTQERERYARVAAVDPEQYRAKFHARRARVLSNGGSYSPEEWAILCARYGDICLMCLKKKKLTVDHILPISQGGTSNIDNLQPLCRSCNARKGDKFMDLRKSYEAYLSGQPLETE